MVREQCHHVQTRVQAYGPEQANDHSVIQFEQDGQRSDGHERHVIKETSHRRYDDAVEAHDGQARVLEDGQQITIVVIIDLCVFPRAPVDVVTSRTVDVFFAVKIIRDERDHRQQTVERHPERLVDVGRESQNLHRSSDDIIVCEQNENQTGRGFNQRDFNNIITNNSYFINKYRNILTRIKRGLILEHRYICNRVNNFQQ